MREKSDSPKSLSFSDGKWFCRERKGRERDREGGREGGGDDVGDSASDMEGEREQQEEREAAKGHSGEDLRRSENVREL